MEKRIKSICAVYKTKSYMFFEYGCSPDYCLEDDCIPWCEFEFYGITEDTREQRIENAYSGDFSGLEVVSTMSGYLILGSEIACADEDVHAICDDVDADLEYITSALCEDGEILDIDPFCNIFYIHEFKMCDGYEAGALKARIIEEFPHLCMVLCHVKPDILAYYPSPLEYTRDDVKRQQRQSIVEKLAAQKLNNYNALECADTDKPTNIIELGQFKPFSDEKIDMLLGRRLPGDSYPEAAKNSKEFDFYEANGFIESGTSRVLYKMVKE